MHVKNASVSKPIERRWSRCVIRQEKSALSVWLRWLATLLNLDGACDVKLWILQSSGQFFSAESHCVPRCGHNDYETGIFYTCPGFFLIVTDRQKAPLVAWPSSHLYGFYSAAEKIVLAKTPEMKCVTIPACSVFGRHGHRQYAGSKR